MKTYQYFDPMPETPAEASKMYKRLALKLHPDIDKTPGATERMQTLNAEYARLLSSMAHMGESARQRAAHAEGKKTSADYINLEEVCEELRAVIQSVLDIGARDIEIELCGLWVWVTGNTKPVHEQIKAAGLKWAHKKAAWYFAGCQSFGRGGWDMDTIRNTYGSRKVNAQDDEKNAKNPARPAPSLAYA
jgi:hypothetical protein